MASSYTCQCAGSPRQCAPSHDPDVCKPAYINRSVVVAFDSRDRDTRDRVLPAVEGRSEVAHTGYPRWRWMGSGGVVVRPGPVSPFGLGCTPGSTTGPSTLHGSTMSCWRSVFCSRPASQPTRNDVRASSSGKRTPSRPRNPSLVQMSIVANEKRSPRRAAMSNVTVSVKVPTTRPCGVSGRPTSTACVTRERR
jgi:hypothetical protein